MATPSSKSPGLSRDGEKNAQDRSSNNDGKFLSVKSKLLTQIDLRQELVGLIRDDNHAGVVNFIDFHGDFDLNTVDDNGDLPLHYACFRGNIKNVTCLLNAGASPDVYCMRDENSLMCTLRAGNTFSVDCIALLAEKSQSPTSYVNQTFYNQETVMHRAACTAGLTILKELVAVGGNMKAERRDRVTPLQLLGMNGRAELEHFYDSESLEVLAMENSEGVSCLTYAVLQDSGGNIEYILNRFTDDMIMTKCPDMWKLAVGNDRFNAISALARLDLEDEGNKSSNPDAIRMFSDSWIHSQNNSVSS
jgi:ankyrin repeat protein